jgi:hypothetical protein
MSRALALIVVVICLLGPPARAQGPTSTLPPGAGAILLQSYVGDPPEAARHYVSYLIRTLGVHAPRNGLALQRELERLSAFAGGAIPTREVRARVEEGRRQFIEGEFSSAIALLEEARRALQRHVAQLASDQRLRDTQHRALLVLAHAYLRTRQRALATDRIGEVIRSFPDRDLSLVQYGPELVKLYRDVRRELDRQRHGALTVVTQPAGCLVFLNERYLGVSPTRAVDLHPGRYRVYVQRAHGHGRVHWIDVSSADHRTTINFDFDAALRSEPYPGLRFPDQPTLEANELAYAATVGRALDAATVIVVGFRPHQGRRTLFGSAVASATGRVLRSALVVLEPTPPSPTTLRALGRFLVAGESGAGVIVRSNAATPRGEERRSARVFKWITLGAAAGALAAGIPLLVLHGRGTCDSDVRCPERYSTLTPGIILTVLGGVAAGTSAGLFYLDARKRRRGTRAVVAPWGTAHAAGVSAFLRF